MSCIFANVMQIELPRLMESPGRCGKLPPGSLGTFCAWAHSVCEHDKGYPWLWGGAGCSNPLGNEAGPSDDPIYGKTPNSKQSQSEVETCNAGFQYEKSVLRTPEASSLPMVLCAAYLLAMQRTNAGARAEIRRVLSLGLGFAIILRIRACSD